jgi:flagellar M-ring protein FliF
MQTSEAGGATAAAPSGVPGATSNQPPVPATAPITGAAAPLQASQTGAGASNTRRDSVTNYEVDKTVRVTRNATGTVKRLNAAVVVNHRVTTAANGKTSSTPLTNEEVEKLTALVQESIGFSKERGDSVKLINAPFRTDAAPKVEALPLWQQPHVLDMLRSGAVPGALTLVALMILFGLVRPALKAALPAPNAKGGRLNAVADDPVPMPTVTPALAAPTSSEKLIGVRGLAKENPAAVANIVRGWVSKEAA